MHDDLTEGPAVSEQGNILFYDFETTGLPDWSKPSDGAQQPHIVQVAAILADGETGDTICAIDLIARPEGWEIPEKASAIHGITTLMAGHTGMPEKMLVRALWYLWLNSSLRVGHNESFDARIMRIALLRHADRAKSDRWKLGKRYCTCDGATPLVKAPPTEKMIAAGRGKQYKRANLGEAYMAATGKELVGAHSAMPDVLACKAVYEWLQEQGGE